MYRLRFHRILVVLVVVVTCDVQYEVGSSVVSGLPWVIAVRRLSSWVGSFAMSCVVARRLGFACELWFVLMPFAVWCEWVWSGARV